MTTRPTRLAGWGRLADGGMVTWTLSDGRRGRRWREVVADGEAVRHALLLETDPAGLFSHLELAAAHGLWTLHPETDGTLHGNHVDPEGATVRHVSGWVFAPADWVVIAGSPIAAAAIAWRQTGAVAEGSSLVRAGVVLDLDGRLTPDPAIRLERLSVTGWRVGSGDPFEISTDGAPVLVGGGSSDLEVG